MPLTLHRIEEVRIVLGRFEPFEQEVDRRDFFHGMEQFAQDPHFLQFIRMGKQFFPARSGTVDVDCGEDSFLVDLAVKMNFHIARALELLVDHIVHA